ncbi:AsnC family protein [Nodosilinea sp. LEGE 07088]|uniref:AsnC family protein n=1 Tax=Nodosilinea sp. LEGE 07088 TaxID=2777968 RepID=UPI0018814862|nr:AsnC family protein [Nodosilinea sp. LEGE 07088]MBE9139314.1 AsnC family protein [Nodosilinea sp. LEGE 07088]
MTNDQTQLVVQQLLSCLRADSRSSSEIARLASVSQPTVSRMRRFDGKRLRISQSFNKLCNFYDVPSVTDGKASHGYDSLLRDAIIDAWDGTEAGGRALLTVIKGLRGLNKRPDDTAGNSLGHI